eukprot:gene11001-12249_t
MKMGMHWTSLLLWLLLIILRLDGGNGFHSCSLPLLTRSSRRQQAAGSLQAIDWAAVATQASEKALSGGMAGASAAALQVLTLMWLRTAVNYQYRYGGSLSEALSTLYKEGGLPRLYRGVSFALVQGPLSRFGDTAANALALALIASLQQEMTDVPLFLQTGLGSLLAGLWRIGLTPVDNAKTTLQVSGSSGLENLLANRLPSEGISVLFNGALASSAATFAGHYPWFLVFNYLSSNLTTAEDIQHFLLPWVVVDRGIAQIGRSAVIGLCATSTSDLCTNALRVLKTSRQTALDPLTGKARGYLEITRDIVDKEGVVGLLGRGLKTKLLANGLQGMLFSVVFQALLNRDGADKH